MGSKFDWWQFVDSSGANFLIQMNVALGVAGGGMACQHGDGTEVDVEGNEVGNKGVAGAVERDVFVDARVLHPLVEDL